MAKETPNKGGQQRPFVFNQNDSIGSVQAELDDKYLASCFLDNGTLQTLVDCESHKCIIVGRTGSGKSALLLSTLRAQEHVVLLRPHDLSIQYISNSTILRFFADLGVKLDLFFRLLWRHVLAVELIKLSAQVKTEPAMNAFIAGLYQRFRGDRNKQRGLDYLKHWGDKFWQETEDRIKEIVSKFETDLKADAAIRSMAFDLGAGASTKMTEETRREVAQHGTRVVNEIQIRHLTEVLDVLGESVLVDDQKSYYILIDQLDEDWADDSVRFHLIRALIEELKIFRKIRRAKIILAMRTDLLEQVFDRTRDAGFQEEKYRDMCVYLQWTETDLHRLVDLRMAELVRYKYTGRAVAFDDVFVNQVAGGPPFSYICDRTLLRPRDLIVFVNECLRRAAGRSDVPATMIREAEGPYSVERLESVCFEWRLTHPLLKEYLCLLQRRVDGFKASEISRQQLSGLTSTLWRAPELHDPVKNAIQRMDAGEISHHACVIELLQALFHVGIIGIKTDAHTPTHWASISERGLSPGQIKPTSTVHIHPMFWRALGLVPDR